MNTELENIPPFNFFRDEIKKIYPDGDLAKSYDRLKWYIENDPFCADGTPLSYRLIMDKFASHIKNWNAKYGSRDPKYVGKGEEEKRKNLWDFIGMRYYEREFSMTGAYNERDDYLFGSFSKSYLQQVITEFDNTMKDGE